MLGPMTSEPVAMLHIGCLLKNQWWLANLIYSLSQKKGTHCCIPLKGIMWVRLYFFCNSQFHMSWCSVAKWKCHHMTPCASLDGLTMLITIAKLSWPTYMTCSRTPPRAGRSKWPERAMTFDFFFTPSGSVTSIPVISKQRIKII